MKRGSKDWCLSLPAIVLALKWCTSQSACQLWGCIIVHHVSFETNRYNTTYSTILRLYRHNIYRPKMAEGGDSQPLS